MYAILRTEKISTFGGISGSSSHNFRERTTTNADDARTPRNRSSGAQSVRELVGLAKSRLATVPTIRKNAVLAIEYFIGASPEFFVSRDAKDREGYFNKVENWLKEKHGAENVICVTRHYDEISPHICAYVIPIDPKGKLNCSYFLDGREKLSAIQTDFAEKCGKPFGLMRGIEGSKAKHQTVKQYYAKIQAQTPELKTKIPEVPEATIGQKIAEAAGIETEHSRALEVQKKAIEKRAAEYRAMRAAEQSKAKQYEIEKAASRAREVRLAELRATATQARDLPLGAILERLECIPDPKDKKNWRTPIGRITVDGPKFYAHDIAKGGGGAIDLVMVVEGLDYKGAVNKLAQAFGTGAVLAQAVSDLKPRIEAAASAPPAPYHPPEPKIENWPKVRNYLIQQRKIKESTIDALHRMGKVYADQYSNAVFVLGRGQGIGAELRGTGEKPFHGVRGQKAPFILSSRGDKKVAFVESSIDALSLYDLGFRGQIVATIGSSQESAKKRAEAYRAEGLEVIAAFDRDKAGDAMSRALGQPTTRLLPAGKDWNDDLVRTAGAAIPDDPECDDPDYPSM